MKKEYTIHFKSGNTKVICGTIANIIKNKVIAGEAKQFQFFSDVNDGEEVLMLTINISEIEFID